MRTDTFLLKKINFNFGMTSAVSNFIYIFVSYIINIRFNFKNWQKKNNLY